ncbi:MAG: TonB-dependent receptor, partial [Brevundimonas sp.]
MKTVFTGRARLLSGAAIGAIMLSAIAGGAMAQTTTTTTEEGAAQVDDIIVTGIRAGIESSIREKKNNTSIVEVITAEDIGKLPDVSIAESLARLPGLTSQRLDGRSQVISIRGLGPDFTTALLNGREQVTTGDNRGVEFDQYPSELLGGVLVYKTPNATLVGQGLAGTVDLQAVRPLEYGRQAIALNARYEWNDIGALNAGSTDHGERYTISYIDQFADDTIGVALGYAHMGSPYQSERYEGWGYPTDGNGDLIIGGEKVFVMSGDLQRDGYFGVFEWRPNERFHTTLDAFYSEFDNTQMISGIEFPLYWGGGVATSNTQSDNGFVTSGTFSNVNPVVRSDRNDRTSTLTSIGWNGQLDLGNDWSIEADLSHSAVERDETVTEAYAGTGRNGSGPTDTINFDVDGDGVTVLETQLDYADPNLVLLTSPQGWGGDVIPGGQDGYYKTFTVEDELNAARFTLRRDLHDGTFSRFTAGVSGSTREKSYTANEFFLGIPNGASVKIPDAYYLGTTDLSYAGVPGVVTWDALGLINDGFYNLVRNPNGDVRAKDWVVKEDLLISYVMLDIDAMAGSVPVTGNLGMQAQYADQESSGYQASGTGREFQSIYITRGDKYLEILPSANLIFELKDDLFLRTALSRTLSRPRMDDMRASRTYSLNEANNFPNLPPDRPLWSASGGNPELRPWIADVA